MAWKKPHLLMANRKVATWAAILAPLTAAAAVPIVTHTVGAQTAQADDLTSDGTQPAPPPAPDPGPGTFDDLTNDGTQPPPPQPPDPGPGTFDDLTNDGTQPPPPPAPDPGPGTFDDLTNEDGPPSPPSPPVVPGTPPSPPSPPVVPGTPPSPAPATPPSPNQVVLPSPGMTVPTHPVPPFRRLRQAPLVLSAPKRITSRRLRKGLAVRLTAKAPAGVLVTMRGPGRSRTQLSVRLGAGTRKLTLQPHLVRGAGRGRKLTVVVTGTASDGTRIKLRRTIRIRG